MKVKRKEGFTLVEIMIVVSVIGLLALMCLPAFARARNIAQGVRVANDLKTFGHAFALYAMENGQYPQDSHEALPTAPDIESYIKPSKFNESTAFGGRYNWEGPDRYPYAGVSVSSTRVMNENLLRIDAVVDDGNLSTGHFRLPGNGRYTFIIEE